MSRNCGVIEEFSKNASNFLNKSLEINPNERLNVDEILNHP